jgi:hypothetical protein
MNDNNRKEYLKKYYEINKEAIKEKSKKYREKNKEKIKQYNKEYKKNNLEYTKEYNINYLKKYRLKNKDYYTNYLKEYQKINKESLKEYNKDYREKNENKNKYNLIRKERKENDPLYKLTCNIRTLISFSLKVKGYQKESRTHEILGCSYEDFKIYLESKFETWMNWDNYGNPKDGLIEPNKSWDIDHIIPLSSATNEEELLKFNHYTNLQPLCSYENRFIKRNSL